MEPILKENPDRYSLFPINYPDIWAFYKKAEAATWTANEIDFGADLKDWQELNDNERYFIEHILAFFAGSDGLVLENLMSTFATEIQIPEARAFYAHQGYIETVHCVSGNTRIMTKNGYFEISELENQKVDIWNGEEWSNVEIKYTGDQMLYRVELDNGMELDCTDKHKWFVRTGNSKMEKRFTKNLKNEDIIYTYELPVIDMKDSDEFKNPYIHGFFCGDGTKAINKQKFEVPINYSINTKLRWLEGYVDSDGCVSYNTKKTNTSIQIVSIDKEFLKNVQLMISTLGIHTNVKLANKDRITNISDGKGGMEEYICKSAYVLYITICGVKKLISLGFKPKRLVLKIQENVNSNPKLVRIKNIEEIDIQKTYCFSEPKKHAGIFNGILTGQSETYAKMIDTLIKDVNRKRQLFNAIGNIPCVTKKAKWAEKWMNLKTRPFRERLIGFIIVEGLFFSGSFCSIFWLKSRGKMINALAKSNEFIARDEGMHTTFGIMMYKLLETKCKTNVINDIFQEAVEIEVEFICESLPCKLIGMNSELMIQYIKFVADNLLIELGYPTLYDTECPFDFMDNINLSGKSNFFEQRPSEYSKAYSVSDSSERIFDKVFDDKNDF